MTANSVGHAYWISVAIMKAINIIVNGPFARPHKLPRTEANDRLMDEARETSAKETDKFHNLLSSLGFEPPNHGVVAIVANHLATAVTFLKSFSFCFSIT